MNALILAAYLLLAVNCSQVDICDTKAFRSGIYKDCHDYIKKEHAGFTISQLRMIGKSSNVCSHLDDDDLASLQKIKVLGGKALIEILPFNCIKNIVKHSIPNFHQIYADIQYQKDDRDKKFFRKHSEEICACQILFQWTNAESKLTSFCEAEDERKKLELSRNENHRLLARLAELSLRAEASSHAGSSMAALLAVTIAILAL